MSDVNVRNGKATGCAERPKEPPADRKREVLKQVFGYESFRDGQETLIDAILAGRDAFGIMPTGVGNTRADRYGETFLAVIDDYLASFGA